MQLLRVCEMAISETGTLEGVDGVLGCPILTFHPKILESFDQQSVELREQASDSLFVVFIMKAKSRLLCHRSAWRCSIRSIG